jgi:hypothetical protein
LTIQNNETQAAGLTISRDLPAIAKSELQLDAAPLSHNPEHITKTNLLAPTLRLELLPNLGKYWVLRCGIISISVGNY